MSLQDRIDAQKKLDLDFLIQNDKISVAARPRLNYVATFNKIDEDLLEEYNRQFPKGFEYIDKNGEKKI